MQLTTKLTQILPIQIGTGKKGEWKKQDIIVETDGKYPKKICVSVWGDKIHEDQLQIGNQLKIDYDLESREFNNRWYTEVKAIKIELVGSNIESSGEKYVDIATEFSSDDNDVLPF